MNNITLVIKNLNINIEYKENHFFKLKISEIQFFSANYLWEKGFVDPGRYNIIRKLITISNFQLFFYSLPSPSSPPPSSPPLPSQDPSFTSLPVPSFLKMEEGTAVGKLEELEANAAIIQPFIHPIDITIRFFYIQNRIPNAAHPISFPENRIDILFSNLSPLTIFSSPSQFSTIKHILFSFIDSIHAQTSSTPPPPPSSSSSPSKMPSTPSLIHSSVPSSLPSTPHPSHFPSQPAISRNKQAVPSSNQSTTGSSTGWISWITNVLVDDLPDDQTTSPDTPSR